MQTISLLIVFSCLFLLGSSRVNVSIRVVAFQGLLLGLLPIVVSHGHISSGIWLIALSGIILKGIMLPLLLNSVLHRTGNRRENKPFVGFSMSIMSGIMMLGLAVWLTRYLGISEDVPSAILTSTGIYLVFIGMFLMIGRRKAIMQSLAYLVLENGVYAVGIGIHLEFPIIIELGVLLDVFVGVFLMADLLYNIDSEFKHTDADKLSELSEISEGGQS